MKWTTLAVVAGFATAQTPRALTALDYIQIQQLLAKYAFALDTCSNHGEDFANLFTPDGVFTLKPAGREWRGHEKLVQLAGGPSCERAPGTPLTHTTENAVIEPSPEGATGKSYAIYPGGRGEQPNPNLSGHVGMYEDVYVKTPKGWRFRSRVHVLP